MSLRADAMKLTIFLIIGALIFTLLYLTFARVTVGEASDYDVVLADVNGLQKGDAVRVAGVQVGQVDQVRITSANRVRVSFSLAERRLAGITDRTLVQVRYENLLGDRFLELSQRPGTGRRLAPGSTLPAGNGQAGLDLDVLLNGFRPLLRGLEPERVNELASSLVAVLQGREDMVRDLFGQTASLTHGLADNDEAIGTLVTNLDAVLGNLNAHEGDLRTTLRQLRRLVSGLAEDRDPIGQALTSVADLSASLGEFVAAARPPLRTAVVEARRLAATLADDAVRIASTLGVLPGAYDRLKRIGSHSSSFAFYLCSLQVEVTGPNGQPLRTPLVSANESSERCR